MAEYSSPILGEYGSEIVEITCDCGRAFEPYSKAALVRKYGADITLPELRHRLAGTCEHRGAPGKTCKVRYV